MLDQKKKNSGSRVEPWGTPQRIYSKLELKLYLYWDTAIDSEDIIKTNF